MSQQPVKIIEFVAIHFPYPINFINQLLFKYTKIEPTYVVITVDLNEIKSIAPIDKTTSKLSIKGGQEYIVIGTHRSLNNRWIYGIEKKFNFYEDNILRPSITIYHRPKELMSEQSFLDPEQLKSFILALSPELLEDEYIKNNVIPNYN